MNKPSSHDEDYQALSELYIFEEIYNFAKASTGLAIAISYLILLLSSMAYLYVFYGEFNVQIVKYITFEDILATPLKNPLFLFILLMILCVLSIADAGNRMGARYRLEYADKPKPILVKVLIYAFWAPKNRKTNIKTTGSIVVLSFCVYVYAAAHMEANGIKEGKGSKAEITLADDTSKVFVTLLGSTTNYVFTYDHEEQEAIIYYVESIRSLKELRESGAAEQETQKQTPKADINV
ncbi:hypothetical protein [Alteromonas facilis]|uniref:hypothetical protein n=1 Tax=Alteromonas facilis TaxID=2048004 RepID=UPI000C28463C|nr:hypothetical protein [Alteromonas facilis]